MTSLMTLRMFLELLFLNREKEDGKILGPLSLFPHLRDEEPAGACGKLMASEVVVIFSVQSPKAVRCDSPDQLIT
jgi:hypothetical protein